MQSVLSIAGSDAITTRMHQTLGTLVRRAREAQGLKAYELAQRLKMQQSTLSRIENDQRIEAPAPDVLAGLSREIGLREEDMLRALGYLRAVPKPTTGNTEEDARRAEAHAIVDRLSADQLAFAVLVLTSSLRGLSDADLANHGMSRQPKPR